MAVYAISDIHGCYDEFLDVLSRASFSPSDELYILGDVVDRGPKVAETIQWLVDHDANGENSNVHFLLGNHEQMMSWSFDGRWRDLTLDMDAASMWLGNGGHETIGQMALMQKDDIDKFQDIVEAAPHDAAIRIGSPDAPLVVLSHAGLAPPEDKKDIADEQAWFEQGMADLIWNGMQWYTSKAFPPFQSISGHVPTCVLANLDAPIPGCTAETLVDGLYNRIMRWDNKCDIDCGCCFGGTMGLLRLDDWEAFYAPSHQAAW
ncbi:MAG: hypothetical protein BZ138_06845 [Methanosphaera sp. rholeuAM270]|nr:MAG: hypothetical protein BZ138_06845 [Methanosphaera sp. rholeuAM270]